MSMAQSFSKLKEPSMSSSAHLSIPLPSSSAANPVYDSDQSASETSQRRSGNSMGSITSQVTTSVDAANWSWQYYLKQSTIDFSVSDLWRSFPISVAATCFE